MNLVWVVSITLWRIILLKLYAMVKKETLVNYRPVKVSFMDFGVHAIIYDRSVIQGSSRSDRGIDFKQIHTKIGLMIRIDRFEHLKVANFHNKFYGSETNT